MAGGRSGVLPVRPPGKPGLHEKRFFRQTAFPVSLLSGGRYAQHLLDTESWL